MTWCWRSAHSGNAPQAADDETDKDLALPIDRFIDLISGIFTPVLSVLIATGMIKRFYALLTSTGIVAAKGGTAQMLNILGDMFFYFLPIFRDLRLPASSR